MAIGPTTYGVGSTGGNREEVLKNSLTTLEPTKTPFTSMLNKISVGTVFTEVGGDRLEAPSIAGSAEGDSGTKGGNATLKRARFGVYPQRWFKQWSVSDVQQLVSKKGGNYFTQNEADFAYAKKSLELKRDIEATLLSGQECTSTSTAAMKTRGAYKWLSNVATLPTPAVPSDFMPSAPASSDSECLVSVANISESHLSTVLRKLSDVDGGGGEYTMFASNLYCEDMDFLLRTETHGSAAAATRFNVNHADTDQTINMVVKTFRSTFGVVHVVPAKWHRMEVAGNATGTGDPDACLILNMELWDFGMLEDINESYTWKDSGGEGGDLKAIGSLLCYSPRGNGFAVAAANMGA